MYSRNLKTSPRFLFLAAMICTLSLPVLAQEGSKSIKSEEYLLKRDEPAGGVSRGSSANASKTSRPQAGPRNAKTQRPNNPVKVSPTGAPLVYIVDKNFPEGPAPRNYEYVSMGVTIWRLSPNECPIQNCPLPKAAANSKGLVDTATRVEENVPLNNGERVRLGIESLSHSGYIYIIDREQFADGSLGEGYLIFPTGKIDQGKNWARPGLQIHLPRAGGCFCVKSRDPQKVLVADILTVIISPTPILSPGEIGADAIPMPAKMSAYLSRADKERVFRGMLRGGAGLTQSIAEQKAGTKGLFDTEPVLTRSDLPPQSLYQSAVPIGTAGVFNFSLQYNSRF